MPPQPPKRTATGNGPRHAAGPAPRAQDSGAPGTDHSRSSATPSSAPPAPSSALTGGTGGFPHVQVLEGETTLGRHRRPESLADATVLRPAPAGRVAGGRRSTLDLSSRSSSRSSRAATPSGASSSRSSRFSRAADSTQASDSSRGVGSMRGAAPSRAGSGRDRPPRGRHAKPEQPVVTVRPIPAVRDALRPSTGSHRAPGTLPIESWLKASRPRQGALLAAVVAAGMLLIGLPIQQRGNDAPVNPVAAADHEVATQGKPKTEPQAGPAPATKPQQEQKDAAPAPTTPAAADPARPAAPAAPSAGATNAGAAPAPEEVTPAILVPPGEGPGQSLITTGTPTVALTFDDGPDPDHTPPLLTMLDKQGVKATFCLVGAQVKRHPQIVRDIVAAGHTLCNHTWDHSLTIGKAKPRQIRADLERTNAAIREAVPGAAIPFFRAPGGNFTDRLVQTAYQGGMVSLYWEVDPADWNHPEDEDSEQHIARLIKVVQDETKPGSIVLSHDFNQPDTITAYETLIPWLKERFTLGLPAIPPPPTAAPPAPGGVTGTQPTPGPSGSAG